MHCDWEHEIFCTSSHVVTTRSVAAANGKLVRADNSNCCKSASRPDKEPDHLHSSPSPGFFIHSMLIMKTKATRPKGIRESSSFHPSYKGSFLIGCGVTIFHSLLLNFPLFAPHLASHNNGLLYLHCFLRCHLTLLLRRMCEHSE